MLIAITLTAALAYSWDLFRLAIIRATIDLPLPGWLQAIIQGLVTGSTTPTKLSERKIALDNAATW